MNEDQLREYQWKAFATAIYPDAGKGYSQYPRLALIEEVGEVAGMFAKRIRDGVADEVTWRTKLKKELGDVLWACAAIATEKGHPLVSIESYTGSLYVLYVEHLAAAAARLGYGTVVYLVEYIAQQYGMTLQEVADANLAKLAARQQQGQLGGSGSDREEVPATSPTPSAIC